MQCCQQYYSDSQPDVSHQQRRLSRQGEEIPHERQMYKTLPCNGSATSCKWRRSPLTIPLPPTRSAYHMSPSRQTPRASPGYTRIDCNTLPAIPSTPDEAHSTLNLSALELAKPEEEKKFRFPGCGREERVCGMFLVVVPMMISLMLAGAWVYGCKQDLDSLDDLRRMIGQHILRIGSLIIEFNTERELTTSYVTARTPASQATVRSNLVSARSSTDQALTELQTLWPSSASDSATTTLPSALLFRVLLEKHRESIKVGDSYFWDEIQFYTGVIDQLIAWLNSEMSVLNPRKSTSILTTYTFEAWSSTLVGLWPWLVAYAYLMGSLNYVGGEQALCTAFHSVVCFGHRETFYYANFTFAAEAIFRLYRGAYPVLLDVRETGWTNLPQENFFHSLAECRREIFSDRDYFATAIDPSLCDFGRRNETTLSDTDLLTVGELGRVVSGMDLTLDEGRASATTRLLIASVILSSVALYVLVTLCVKFVCFCCKHCGDDMPEKYPHGNTEEFSVAGNSHVTSRDETNKQLGQQQFLKIRKKRQQKRFVEQLLARQQQRQQQVRYSGSAKYEKCNGDSIKAETLTTNIDLIL